MLTANSNQYSADFLVNFGSKIKLTSANISLKQPYTPKLRIYHGDEEEVIPSCNTKEEFQTTVNDMAYARITLVDNKWRIQPKASEYGSKDTPAGIYKNGSNSFAVVKVSSGFAIKKQPNLTLPDNFLHILAGEETDVSGHKALTATGLLHTTLQESIALSGEDFVLAKTNEIGSKYTPYEWEDSFSQITYHKALGWASHQVEKMKLYGQDFVCGSANVNTTRFRIALQNEGEGFLMDSPNFQICRTASLDHVICGFKLRVGKMVYKKRLTILNPINTEAKYLIFQVESNKLCIYTDTEDVLLKVAEGTVDLPSDCRLCIKASTEIEINRPQQQALSTITGSNEGILAMTFQAPASDDYTLCQNNFVKVEIASGAVKVNDVSTAAQIVQGGKYLLVVSIEAGELVVWHQDLTSDANTGVVSYPNAALTSQSAYSGNFTFLSEAGILGEVYLVPKYDGDLWMALYDDLYLKFSANALKEIGTLQTNGTFSLAATTSWSSSTYALTRNGIVHARIVPKLGARLQQVLRMDKAEIYETQIGSSDAYDERIAGVNFYLYNLQLAQKQWRPLLYTHHGGADTEIDCHNSEFVPFGWRARAQIKPLFLDAIDGKPSQFRGKQPSSYSFQVQ